MKETIHVSIASQAFTLNTDAYSVLKGYLNDIRSRLPAEDTETMNDIEGRVAEIFCEKSFSPMMVITLATVRAAMAQLGSPAEFGEKCTPGSDPAEEEAAPQRPRLYRSRANRSIAGVCGGLGEFFDIDSTLIRLITLLLILFGGLSLWVYIILWIIIPEAPRIPRKCRI